MRMIVALAVAMMLTGASSGWASTPGRPSPRPAETYVSFVERVGGEPWELLCMTDGGTTLRMMDVVRFDGDNGGVYGSVGRAVGSEWLQPTVGATVLDTGVAVRPFHGPGAGAMGFRVTSDGSQQGLLRMATASWGAPTTCTFTAGSEEAPIAPGPSTEAHIAEVSDFGGGAGVQGSNVVGANVGVLLSTELDHDGELFAALGRDSIVTAGAGRMAITDPVGETRTSLQQAWVWGESVPGPWRYEIDIADVGLLPEVLLWAIELPPAP